jgi:hypothetical protein
MMDHHVSSYSDKCPATEERGDKEMGILSWLTKVGSPEGTARTLSSVYEKFKGTGATDVEARLRMLSTRPAWMGLPKAFLLELVQRLERPENICKLVILAEGHGILKNNIRKFATNGASCACLATTFTSLGNHLGEQSRAEEAFDAFKLALMLDPDWMPAMVGLGLLLYQYQMYRDAALYFEIALNSEQRFHLAKADLTIVEQMYNECRKHI